MLSKNGKSPTSPGARPPSLTRSGVRRAPVELGHGSAACFQVFGDSPAVPRGRSSAVFIPVPPRSSNEGPPHGSAFAAVRVFHQRQSDVLLREARMQAIRIYASVAQNRSGSCRPISQEKKSEAVVNRELSTVHLCLQSRQLVLVVVRSQSVVWFEVHLCFLGKIV